MKVHAIKSHDPDRFVTTDRTSTLILRVVADFYLELAFRHRQMKHQLVNIYKVSDPLL